MYITFLERDVENFEDHIAVCGNLAHLYHIRGELAKELHFLYRSFEFDLPRADYCCRIGLWYEMRHEYEKAVYWYELALTREMPPNHFGLMNKSCWTWAPHIQLVMCYNQLGQISKAYEHNEKALEYLRDEPTLLNNRLKLEETLKDSVNKGSNPS
jgi:tetratricopeptide (TPR) repeat protein